MRVVLVTQGVNPVLTSLSRFLGNGLIGVIESAPKNYNPVTSLLAHSLSLRIFCFRHSISYMLLHRFNKNAAEIWLANLQPDLVVVYSMSQLLAPSFLGIPRLGCVNLHPSILPSYRGPNPFFWVYFNQEKIGGVTLHFIDEGEDTGDIIEQRTYEIIPGTRFSTLQEIAINDKGVDMILRFIKAAETGFLPPRQSQPRDSPTLRARNISALEHSNIIKWDKWPIERVWHVMRGTEHWLNCIEQPSGLFLGQRWSILRFSKCNNYANYPHLWGQILRGPSGLHVACRDGLIEIELRVSVVAIFKAICKYVFRQLFPYHG